MVAIRAASHIIFALVGVWMMQKRYNLILTGVVTALLHGIFEGLVVYLFLALGFTPATEGTPILVSAFYITGVGTVLHDIIDYVIACSVGFALSKAKLIPALPPVWGKQ